MIKKALIVFLFNAIAVSYAQDIKFDWAQSRGNVLSDNGQCITSSKDGNIYITGNYAGMVDFDDSDSNFILNSRGSATRDIYVLKLTSSGAFEWVKSMGSNYQSSGPGDIGMAIVTDASENVYTTGGFEIGNVDFDPGPGSFILSSNGGDDVFIQKLNINGEFVWARSIGSKKSDDLGSSIGIDHDKNVYVVGSFGDTVDFDPGPGTFFLAAKNWTDIFILKLDSNGIFQWAHSIGTPNLGNKPKSIAVDQFGNSYTVGQFNGTLDFDPGPSTYFMTSNNALGLGNMFILKLDPNGNFVWAKQVNCIVGSGSPSIAIKDSSRLYITGMFSDTVDFDPNISEYKLISPPGNSLYNPSGFVLALDQTGDFIWASAFNRIDGRVEGYSIDVDNNGDVLVTGSYSGYANFDPTSSLAILSSTGRDDNFIVKLNSNGAFGWARSIGGSEYNVSNSLEVDNDNNILLTGGFIDSSDFDPNSTIYNMFPKGGMDMFVSKFNQFDCANHTVEKGIVISGLTLTAKAENATYQWLSCKDSFEVIFGETGKSFTISNFGRYAVEITQNGCVDTSDCTNITGIGNDNFTSLRFKLFPNPSSGWVKLTFNNSFNGEVKIFNILGSEVYSMNFRDRSKIDIQFPEQLENGLYMINCQSDEMNVSRRVILKR